MSAHIVRNEVPRDSPVLRVLFHTGTDPGGRRQVLLARHHQRVCIVLHATMGTNTPLHAACSPDGEDGVCLAQVSNSSIPICNSIIKLVIYIENRFFESTYYLNHLLVPTLK